MTKVLISNRLTTATTAMKPNSLGDVSASAWRAALRRIGASTAREVDPECYPVFIYSANSGKLLAVRFAGAAR